jgi:deazaflavin-dependent oxidoreductase (nitroreductase family)
MTGNDFMSWLLRSPFHGVVSSGMLLITVKGRKTGRTYTTPVGYFEDGGYLWVLTSRDRTWWRNLQGGAEVNLFLKRKRVPGRAETVLEAASVQTRLVDYLKHVPQAAKPLGIRVRHGVADAGDVARAARDRLFVRIKLTGIVH